MTDEADNGKASRDVSTIQFPYVDLDEAIKMAGAMLGRGGVPLDRDQLAAAVNQVPNSGAFGAKVGAARMFGLVESTQGKYQLTPLGFDILDSGRATGAKATAFLSVPLYKRVFDDFKGRQLPPRPVGLEQAFVSLGVAPKQKERARQIFDRSARAAGFFTNPAEDRLVEPVAGLSPPPPASGNAKAAPQDEPPAQQAPREPDPVSKRYHPFIEGLLERLPPVDETWPAERRAKWLEAASNIFDLIYKGDGGNVFIAAEPPQTPRKGGE